MKYYKEDSTELILKKEIGSGGQGKIFSLEKPFKDYVIKIYYQPLDKEKAENLEFIKDIYLEEPFENSIIWSQPLFLVYTKTKEVIGYGMHLLKNKIPLTKIISLFLRMQNKINTNWRFNLIVAKNIAIILDKLHANNLIVGDLKDSNILVDKKGIPTFIDVDSFSYNDEIISVNNGITSFGYHPAELDNTNFVYTKSHDNFKLAIIIFQLIFGEHPYQDFEDNSGNTPQDLISKGVWIGHQTKYFPERLLNFNILSSQIQHNFFNSFDQTDIRTTPKAWIKDLQELIQELKQCNVDKTHFYVGENCFWCEKKEKLRFDFWNVSSRKESKTQESNTNSRLIDFKNTGTFYISLDLHKLVDKVITIESRITSITPYYKNKVIFNLPNLTEDKVLRIIVHKEIILKRYGLYSKNDNMWLTEYLSENEIPCNKYYRIKGKLELKVTKTKRFYQIVFEENDIFVFEEIPEN